MQDAEKSTQESTLATEQEVAKKGRYGILAMVFITVVINYMDRTNISVAAGALSEDLSLTTVQMGLIFSAFGWTYSIFQIPGGITVDLIKIRILYPFILTAWSIATIVQGLVSSFAALVGCRMAIGVFEAPSYPCNNKVVTQWFNENERAGAIAVYTSGQFIGLAFLLPVLAIIQEYFGWRGLFIISGVVGIVWAVVWYILYRDPEDNTTDQKAKVEKQEEAPAVMENTKFTVKDIAKVFMVRKLWGVYIGQFCLGGVLMFFLTWFPTYLVEYRGLDFIKSGFLASIPFLAAFCGVLVSGFVSDALTRKWGVSKEVARKAPIIAGMLLSTSIIGANYTDDTFWIVTFLSIAFFGNGLASIAWIFVSLLSPKRYLGLVGGAMNFIGALSAVSVPVIIGFLVSGGDFRPALVFICALAVAGMCSYLFLIGKIEEVKLD
ncbi:MFS transporter [Agaribacter flavus]|uniref:MFS transporter n=1 Tax=Agaribacter flavus TaxID=1902781 RepID=A0ABV7FMN8_9ALTE